MITIALFLLFALMCILLHAQRAWDSETEPERNQLVFDGRHQAYGAFQLRREYDRRLVWAVIGAIGLFGAAVAVPKALAAYGAFSAPPTVPHRTTIITEMVIEPPIAPPKAAEAPKATQPVRQKPAAPITPAGSNIVVVPKDSLPDPGPKTPDPEPDPGPANPAPGGTGTPNPGPPTGAGTAPLGSALGTSNNPRSMGEVARLPEFIGGQEAMARFIQNNIRFPNSDAARQKEWVEFVVDADGTVLRVRAKGRASKAFSEAAERVVRAMPKWIPAELTNGEKTACLLVLPIDFQTR